MWVSGDLKCLIYLLYCNLLAGSLHGCFCTTLVYLMKYFALFSNGIIDIVNPVFVLHSQSLLYFNIRKWYTLGSKSLRLLLKMLLFYFLFFIYSFIYLHFCYMGSWCYMFPHFLKVKSIVHYSKQYNYESQIYWYHVAWNCTTSLIIWHHSFCILTDFNSHTTWHWFGGQTFFIY